MCPDHWRMLLPFPGDGVVSFGAWVLPVSQSFLGGLSAKAVQVMNAFFLLFFLVAFFLPGCNLPPPFITSGVTSQVNYLYSNPYLGILLLGGIQAVGKPDFTPV